MSEQQLLLCASLSSVPHCLEAIGPAQTVGLAAVVALPVPAAFVPLAVAAAAAAPAAASAAASAAAAAAAADTWHSEPKQSQHYPSDSQDQHSKQQLAQQPMQQLAASARHHLDWPDRCYLAAFASAALAVDFDRLDSGLALAAAAAAAAAAASVAATSVYTWQLALGHIGQSPAVQKLTYWPATAVAAADAAAETAETAAAAHLAAGTVG